MTRIPLMLAVGLCALSAGGAKAQVVTDSAGGTVYTVQIKASSGPSMITAGDFTYTYVATLVKLSNNVNVFVNTFSFGSIPQLVPGSETQMGSGFTGLIPITQSGDSITFTAAPGSGLHNAGEHATFSYDSPLPPGGLVNLTPSASTVPGGLGSGLGAPVLGPLSGAPEPSPTAALGLGVLGLAGLVVKSRRRLPVA